jgi:hypothetical protein
MEELITIAIFENAVNAHLLKSRLEAEGIRSYLHDEIMNTLIPAGPFGGVKVQVHLQDSLRAFDIYYDLQDDIGRMEI